jgi:hypothetical protein
MAGFRQLSDAEREAYGMAPLSDEEKQQRDAAEYAKIQAQSDNGTLAVKEGADGTDVLYNRGRAPTAAEINAVNTGQAAAHTPGAFGLTQGPQSGRPDWQLYNDPTYEGNRQDLAGALQARQGLDNLGMNVDPSGAANSAQARGSQMDLIAELQKRARGEGDSLAQLQFQQATDANMSGAMALARSGRGNPGVAMKQALAQQGSIGQNAANQSSQLRLNEQAQAQGQLADVLSGVRGQDLGQRGQDIGIASTDLSAALDQRKQLDEMTKYYTSTGLSLDQAQAEARKQYENLRVLSYNQQRAAQMAEDAAKRQQEAQTVGTVFNSLGQAVGVGVQAYGDYQKNKGAT